MRSAPWEMRDTTSDSAKTVHMLLIFSALFAESAAAENSSSVKPSTVAMTSRNRPVPAAHRSFISNLHKLPFSSSEIALVSCPPMSRTDPQSSEKKRAPRTKAVISLTTGQERCPLIRCRPYPVAVTRSNATPSISSRAVPSGSWEVIDLREKTSLPFSSTANLIVRDPMSIPAYLIFSSGAR